MVLADCLPMKWMEVKGVLIAVGDDSVYDRRILPRSHRTWLLRPALFRPAPPIPISHIDASARRSGQSPPPNDTAEGHGRLMEPWYILLSRFASTNLQHNSIPRVYSALTPSGMKSLLQFEGLWYLFMCEFLGLNSTSKDPKVSMELLFPAWIASSTYLPSCSPSTLGWFQIWTVPGRQPDEILCVVMEWYGMIPALPKHTFGVLAHISSPWSAV